MKAIGGYFELEINNNDTIYYDSAKKLNSGRNAFEYILLHYSVKKIYVPYYSCDVILEPLKRQNISYEFYHIDEQFYPININVDENEMLLYVNYFGIMDGALSKLKIKYSNIIIDNSQAFYAKPIIGMPTFYSPRKFFGLPDGGLAAIQDTKVVELEKDISLSRISHLIKRMEGTAESGFLDFQKNDAKLNNLPIRCMSEFTERILRGVDFEKVKLLRKQNFEAIHLRLKKWNQLTEFIDDSEFCAPMVYPFLRKNNNKLRDKLIENKIFVATYWPSVKKYTSTDDYEFYLTENIVAIPIDQRVTIKDINRIVEQVELFIDGK